MMQNVPFECCDREKGLHDAVPKARASCVQQTSVESKHNKEYKIDKEKHKFCLYFKRVFVPGLKPARNRASGFKLFA